jgi:GTP-binding protein
MQMQSLTLRAAPTARRPELPASSAHLGAAACFLRLPRSIRRRRPRSIRASASLDQEVKEVAAAPAPSGK